MKRSLRRAHSRIWIVLSLVMLVMFLIALLQRQTRPLEAPAVKLSVMDTGS